MGRLDFASLNKDAGNETWCNTFAYWLLLLYDSENQFTKDATEACTAMSFQYDVEDQAQNVEMLIGDAALIPSVFVPVAPVTLGLQWSPFPAAIEALGQPVLLDTKKGETLAVFKPSKDVKAFGLTRDEKHFAFLLQNACTRALDAQALLLLVGSPGWAYNSEDFLEEAPEIQLLMKEFGFVYTLRKPTYE